MPLPIEHRQFGKEEGNLQFIRNICCRLLTIPYGVQEEYPKFDFDNDSELPYTSVAPGCLHTHKHRASAFNDGLYEAISLAILIIVGRPSPLLGHKGAFVGRTTFVQSQSSPTCLGEEGRHSLFVDASMIEKKLC